MPTEVCQACNGTGAEGLFLSRTDDSQKRPALAIGEIRIVRRSIQVAVDVRLRSPPIAWRCTTNPRMRRCITPQVRTGSSACGIR